MEQKEEEDVNYVSVQESPVKSVVESSKASEKSGKVPEDSDKLDKGHDKSEPALNNISFYQDTDMN